MQHNSQYRYFIYIIIIYLRIIGLTCHFRAVKSIDMIIGCRLTSIFVEKLLDNAMHEPPLKIYDHGYPSTNRTKQCKF